MSTTDTPGMILASQADANAAAEGPGWYAHHTSRQLVDALRGTVETADEAANRTRVALWLADVLAAHGSTVDEAEALPDAGWRLVVDLASAVHPGWRPLRSYLPSAATRSAAITVLRERAAHPDPFAGFPQ